MAISDLQKREYLGRINLVLQHINENLDEKLYLHKLAGIACFSPFHFHRIFSTMTGESLNAYIQRKRLERIATRLMQGSDEPLSSIAVKYGFENPSSFSRSFKKHFGLSPTEFKKTIEEPYSKIRIEESKDGQVQLNIEKYICSIDKYLNWLQMNAKIEIKEMPEMKMVYMDHVGPFDQIGRVYEKLFRWAAPKGLLSNPNFKTITLYHDDPKVTEISKLHQSAGITIETDVKVDGEVGMMLIKKDKYAVGHFEIKDTEFEKAWDSMCVWVAEKGYKSKDGHYYELYHNDHMQHPERKFIVDICIPVE